MTTATIYMIRETRKGEPLLLDTDRGFFTAEKDAEDVATRLNYADLVERTLYCNSTRSVGKDEAPVPTFEEFTAPDYCQSWVAPGYLTEHTVVTIQRAEGTN